MKKILAISGAIIVCIIAVLGVLAGIQREVKFSFENPKTIYAYANSSVAIEKDGTSAFEKDSTIYNSLKENFDKMLKTNLLLKVWNNDFSKSGISQDIKGEKGNYSPTSLSSTHAIMFEFENKQRQIVEVDGDTKVIEYYSLMFILGDKGYHEIAVYFKTSTSGSFQNYPMLMRGNPKHLIDCINSIK